MSMHLNDDQLLDRLYGIAEGDTHLDACEECQARWSELLQRRAVATSLAPPAAEYFHQQRREVHKRLGISPRSFAIVLVPATLAVMLMAGLVLTTTSSKAPAPTPSLKSSSIVEVGWFEDAYSATREMEPRAASPIRHLFEAEVVSQ